MSRLRYALAAATLLSTLCGCRSEVEVDSQEPSAPRMERLLTSGEAVVAWHPSVRRARTTRVAFDVTRGEHSPDAEQRSPHQLRLDLFEDFAVDAELTTIRRGRFGFVWVGRIADDPNGEVLLAPSEDGHLVGTVRADGRLFQLMLRDGEQLVVERVEHLIPNEVPPPEAEPPGAQEGVSRALPVSDGGDGAGEIDILVVYTGDALAGVGDQAGMNALIDLAIQETNHGYDESGVAIELRLVGAAQVDYDETELDYEQALNRLRLKDDGSMDEVHALRDDLGADHVVLLVDDVTYAAGIGYVMTSGDGPWFSDWAFSVVARDYATGAYTFAHELGHNMGSEHDHDNAGEGYFPYSHGLRQPEAGFRSIMAYGCDDSWCARVNRWSNPFVELDGVPTGIAGYADNARSLNATAPLSAAFREPANAPPEPEAAELIDPPPGSMLPGDQVTFSWTKVDASQHELWLGAHPGDASYFHGSGLLGTKAVVGNVPTGGETIHARLWSFGTDHVWRYNDYEYTSYFEAEAAAEIVYPWDGSTLWATTIPFVWQKTDASAYRLRVGTLKDPDKYFDSGETTEQDAFAWALPSDGSLIVATLSSLTPAGWLTTKSHYTAYTSPDYAADIAYPVDGTTLPMGAVTFRFTYTSASEHWLELRSSDGVLFSSSTGSDDGVVVEGLPQNGQTIQATLWSMGASEWATTAASFTAASN